MASEELFSENAPCSEELIVEKEDTTHRPQEASKEVEVDQETNEVIEEVPSDIQVEGDAAAKEDKQPPVEGTTSKEKAKEKPNEPRLSQLPLARIRNLMKLDPDLHIATLEAVFAVTKATEMFIDSLAKEAFVHTSQSKKKTVQKRDVDMAIASVDCLMFLEGAMNF